MYARQFLSGFVSLALILTGCSGAIPEQTLSEKLAGKTATERQEVLRLTCLNEAEWTTDQKPRNSGPHRNRPIEATEETKRLKALCRDIADEKNPSSEKRSVFAQQCRDKIKRDLENIESNRQHLNRMRLICEEMTGQKIKIN